ncbi:hypothetical protein HDV05_005385 [Chytridiales sp. JEL 0842]|nr:hypothetical protein HDV05_005385 [Chytridiales sp. JEL 0842]
MEQPTQSSAVDNPLKAAEEAKSFDDIHCAFSKLRDAKQDIIMRNTENISRIGMQLPWIESRYKPPTRELQTIPPNSLLTISFFPPITAKDRKLSRKPTAQIQVHATNFLTDLRDTFTCLSDFVSPYNPSEIHQQLNTKERKVSSSYFFVEGTFYNDMRWSGAVDYSRWAVNFYPISTEVNILDCSNIIQWANEQDRQKLYKGKTFQKKTMAETRFCDLQVFLRDTTVSSVG